MGQFANMLFGALLGWVQTAASWLWGLVTNTNVSDWLRWLLDNWLPLTLLLCIAGLVIDLLVYLLRWQPYRVWRSFFSRFAARAEDKAAFEVQQPILQRKWVYADGTTTVEEIPDPLRDVKPQQEEERLLSPIRPTRRAARYAAAEQAYHQPVYPPQWQQNTQDQQGEQE